MADLYVPILTALSCGEQTPDVPPIRIEAGAHGPAMDLPREELRRLACATGAFFLRLGVEPGDRVVTFLPTGRPLLQSIFGAWAAGAVISVLAPAVDGGRSTLSIDVVRSMLTIAAPKVVVLAEADRPALSSLVLEIGAHAVFVDELPTEGSDDQPHACRPDEAALIQFTSGSTGVPKGVVVEHGQMIENVRAGGIRTGFCSNDCFVNWLPLHHDFGFFVGTMMSILFRARLVLLPTETFIRNPTNWISSIALSEGTYSAATPSALNILCKPMFRGRLSGLNLSKLKTIFLAGEPVSATTVDLFEQIIEPLGARAGACAPGYGMAETTLTISVTDPSSGKRHTSIDTTEFYCYGRVVFTPDGASDSMALLSNGRPLPGVRVRILDDDGEELPDGRQGRIVVSSSMVTRRYFGADEDPQPGGRFETGDLGFLLDGEVYVTGRSKDVIIRNGVNMPAHLIEEAVLRCFPDQIGRAVAFSVPSERDLRDEVVVAVEPRRGGADQGFATTVRAAVLHELNFAIDRVEVLPKGSIPRTTSGKLQRARARDLYRRGELALGLGEEVS